MFTSSAFWLPILTAVIAAVITDIDAYIKTKESGKTFDFTLTIARILKSGLAGAAVSLGAIGINQ